MEQPGGPYAPPRPGVAVARPRSFHELYAYPREYLGNRYVYFVISPRARGLLIGVNLSPDRHCNFNCVYCNVDRSNPPPSAPLDIEVLTDELRRMLSAVQSGKLRELPMLQSVPEPLLSFKRVSLSGEGEPTLSPQFAEVVQAVNHLRIQTDLPDFSLVLITNGSGLHLPAVRAGLKWFSSADEIWIKLDAGTQEHMRRINRTRVTLRKSLANILAVARQRPVIIQSLFPLYEGAGPSEEEIEQYVQRLLELKQAGAMIALVQIYSAHRGASGTACGHLPLRTLSHIAERVRAVTGLAAEVY